MATVFIVWIGKGDHERPSRAYTREADAQAYATLQNNLEKQRHPHPALNWRVAELAIDGIE